MKREYRTPKTNRIRYHDEEFVRGIAYVVMTILAISAIAPLVLLLSASFSSEESLSNHGYQFVPIDFSLDAYKYIWAARDTIGQAYLMTIIVTVIGTTLSVMITSMLAYALIQKGIPGQKLISLLLIVTLLFNGGIVASYIIWTNVFHIKNTIFALIFPNLLMNGFSVILVMSYYRTSISPEIIEAARIDGASEARTYFSVMLPLSKPILATVGLMAALAFWGDWTNGLYYLTAEHSELYTIQLLLNRMNQSIEFLAQNPNIAAQFGNVGMPTASVRMAIALVGVLPVLVAYPFFQKYFVAGLTQGGVKG